LFNPTHTYPFKKLEHPRYITLNNLPKHKVRRVAQKASVWCVNLNLLDEFEGALAVFKNESCKFKEWAEAFFELDFFCYFSLSSKKSRIIKK